MKPYSIFPLLCTLLLHVVSSQKCDLTGAKKPEVDFPDLAADVNKFIGYTITVEYTAPDAKLTGYYVEYYDIAKKRGRVDGYQAGKLSSYIYYTESMEAWEITEHTCELRNLTDNPRLMKGGMHDWIYDSSDVQRKTFGPFAMFKHARDVWNSSQKISKMAYMGESAEKVRGLKAQFWRRCDSSTSYVDYFFTSDNVKDPLVLNQKIIPLRVRFGGERKYEEWFISVQNVDIMSFRPYTENDIEYFGLPKGLGCKRGDLVYLPPKMPDFSNKNLQFSAEVIYQKIDDTGEKTQYWSYYSTLTMVIDVDSNHLAYYYSPWSSKKTGQDDEPSVDPPQVIIFDMTHDYAYMKDLKKESCQIKREKSFTPKYKFPNDAGEISLTDNFILFPNNEPYYLTKGETRGLEVNIFEEIVENYIVNEQNETTVPKAVISRSYLKDKQKVVTKSFVEEALIEIQIVLSGKEEQVQEIITFNFYGFSTQIEDQRSKFDVEKCFKHRTDYSWVTLGFNADNDVLNDIKDEIPSIETNVLNSLLSRSQLNSVRVPRIMVDINEGLFVTMMILGKPDIKYDYLPAEYDKTISSSHQVEDMKDFESCANECLETQNNCWGFSMCGAICSYGTSETDQIVHKEGCHLYRRYNGSYIPSRESLIQSLKEEVEEKLIKLVVRKRGGGMVQLECTSIEINDPGEEDRIFNILGNKVDPRMRVVKAGAKLKAEMGNRVTNLENLNFADCQKICLDYQDCETISYCLSDLQCLVTDKYGEEIKEIQENNMCSILSRKYLDHFNKSPGTILSVSALEVSNADSEEKCAKECLKSSKFQCLSFDYCQEEEKPRCRFHAIHYPTSKTKEAIQLKKFNCGHYSRKLVASFKKYYFQCTAGDKLPPITNITVEECSLACMEFNEGFCFGFDFCQDKSITATSCELLYKDPSNLKSNFTKICTTYRRNQPSFAQKLPYSTGFTGSIGFLCFIIGLVVGSLTIYTVAYKVVKRKR